ncbi:DUF1499 domain-containing protein [Alcanivorax sp. JB21]|uniref:DUF1499 domain-containing protein n=1 Tax=Alcanivorax limicola TaxID=2874102 RepID=UPI001CBD5FD2|nr:DUF1499 domain-containing protein [Alcanivorax limicola]MBZ2188059.1 DUF1499 domain-containing protein [Alcanivorax limicola]
MTRSVFTTPLLCAALLLGPALTYANQPAPAADVEPAVPFAPCPKAPNCAATIAHTVAERPDRLVEPLQGGSTLEESRKHLSQVLDALPRVTWESQDTRYVHAVFTSRLMRFKDDVAFWLHDDGRIDVRSASRVGYWDMGANARRIEQLRDELNAAMQPRTE